ncbi:uncharacterized protein Z518_10948 [Rhinocladiella mackenziei CBS 650.93]|uniref:Enoyl-CoA hydratase n=1 Tax=Rhinocladiella mackenziei CBS 650.93 TaxID=1442369 RepID=A0A0D2I9W4_9EURO|nr:uncharacterized protein Z518_10948 [Rhinocladiella mackenziei CBS 650.93]KIX00021.1 hypothetical protein Z518_10948 [Rhinocladiella mackenziei CBS 650.93]
MDSSEESILCVKEGNIATIVLNKPQKLNAVTRKELQRITTLLHEIADDKNIFITVITGSGRFFSAGLDVGAIDPTLQQERGDILGDFVKNNFSISQAFYRHPKILVGALNGPVVGLPAALVGFCDFVYATPHTFLLTPFSSLGLVTEGVASMCLVARMGISKANEALIMSRKIPCDELVSTGFVNKVFSGKDQKDSTGFLNQVKAEIEDKLGHHLNRESLLRIKSLIRRPSLDALDAQNICESMEGTGRFLQGAPQEEFRRIASGEKRHKL